MKKYIYLAIGIFGIIVSGLFVSRPALGDTLGQLPGMLYNSVTGFVYPRVNTAGLQIPSLSSTGNPCTTVDSSGKFATTTCGSGGGSSATTTINGLSTVNYTFSGSGIGIATSAPGTVTFTNTGITASSTITSGGIATFSPNITFSTTTDTNLLLSIFCSTATCTFNPSWTGTLSVARGGTGTSTAPTTMGQLLAADSTGTKYGPVNLVAGSNITIATSTGGQITITSTASGGGGGLGTTSPFTAGYIPEATGTNVTLSNSNIFQSAVGNIGIGTTAPASTLHVAYDASSTASTNFALQLGTKALSSPSANGTYVGLNVPSSFTGNMIDLQNNGTSQFKVTSAGSTLIPSGSLFGAGATSADGGFAIASNNGVELGVGTGKAFIATTAGSKFGQLCVIADAVWGLGQTSSSPTTCGATQAVLVWTGGGLVGIGTSTPIGVLSVQGTSGNLIDVYNGATSEFRITSAGVLTTAGNATISGGTLTAATKVQTNLVSANTTNLTLSGNMSSTAVGDDVTVLNGTSRNTTGAGNATALNLQDTFAPTTGSATFHALHISSTINQTNSASGISRGIFVNPTLTTVADFRALETAAKTVTYSTATIPSIAYQVLFNPYTYVTSSTTNATLSTSTTVDIKGAPIASTTNLAITNSIGLQIESNAVTASTTNAYGAYFWAPSGATNNWSAGFTGHVVYNGPTPVISSCGATPNGSATGNDERFTITVGGGVVTACTATFASTFKNTPVCTVTDNSATIGAGITSASNSAITISTSASLGGGVIYVRCDDWN